MNTLKTLDSPSTSIRNDSTRNLDGTIVQLCWLQSQLPACFRLSIDYCHILHPNTSLAVVNAISSKWTTCNRRYFTFKKFFDCNNQFDIYFNRTCSIIFDDANDTCFWNSLLDWICLSGLWG